MRELVSWPSLDTVAQCLRLLIELREGIPRISILVGRVLKTSMNEHAQQRRIREQSVAVLPSQCTWHVLIQVIETGLEAFLRNTCSAEMGPECLRPSHFKKH